jgi:hypothetical protein
LTFLMSLVAYGFLGFLTVVYGNPVDNSAAVALFSLIAAFITAGIVFAVENEKPAGVARHHSGTG